MSAAHDYDWTPAALETLERLWAEGISITRIGIEMGCSRNAVVAKAHRRNLAPRAPAITRLSAERRETVLAMLLAGVAHRAIARDAKVSVHTVRDIARKQAKKAAAEPPAAAPRIGLTRVHIDLSRATGPGRGVGMLDLSRSQCQWPLWGRERPTFRCCGAPSSPGRPYCAEHAARAYRRVEVPSEQVAA